MLRHQKQILRAPSLLILCCLVAACSQQPVVVVDETVRSYGNSVPLDLSGSWERDYSRGDDINMALSRAISQLGGSARNSGYSNDPRTSGPIISQEQADAVVALARLAELITRQDVFTVEQSAHEISIEREDDFTIFCEFYNGRAQGSVTDYGNEVCGWDGDQFVSQLVLPTGLLVSHRFTMGPDGERMRVITSVSSGIARVPVVLSRFYRKFEPAASKFN